MKYRGFEAAEPCAVDYDTSREYWMEKVVGGFRSGLSGAT